MMQEQDDTNIDMPNFPSSIEIGDIFEVLCEYSTPTYYDAETMTPKRKFVLHKGEGILFLGPASADVKKQKQELIKVSKNPDAKNKTLKELLFEETDGAYSWELANDYDNIQAINFEQEATRNNNGIIEKSKNPKYRENVIRWAIPSIMGYWLIGEKVHRYNFPITILKKVEDL